MPESLISLREAGLCYRRSQGFFKGARSDFWALKSVSLELHRGETLGVLGRNGAGKSTLMRVLAGIILPDRGTIATRPGLRTTLLSIGVGSHSTLSGRQNAILNGMMLGASRRQMIASLDRIKEFSELGDFFEEPIYTYSSGMHARLGFATAMEVDPDIMLIDEMFSVGDSNFKVKSGDALMGRLQSGKTAVLISHDAATIARLCNRAIWIEDGVSVATGDPATIGRQYEEAMLIQHAPIVFDPPNASP
jgi:lipopolysaccharide transport system ATP-binding protein